MPYPYESATPEQKQLGSLWWCIHHEVKLEPLSEPIENRARYIRENKFEHEVETRLRAMRPVTGALPEPMQRVYAEWQRVYAERQRVDAERRRVYAERQRVDAERLRVDAEWQRVVAEWQRVVAEGQRVDAELQRVDAEWQRVVAEWQRVVAEHAAEIDALWAVECADVPWGPDGLVFPEVAR